MSSLMNDDNQLPDSVYRWFNSLVDRREAVTEAEVSAAWTDDCVMITNGQLKCTGIPAFVKHFNEIRQKLKSWEVELPLAIRVASQTRIAVYYRIKIERPDDSAGTVFIGAFFDIRERKLARMTEVAHFQGAELALENH